MTLTRIFPGILSGILLTLASLFVCPCGWAQEDVGLSGASETPGPATDEETLRQSFEKFVAMDLRRVVDQTGLPEVEQFTDEELRRVELGRRLFFDTLLSSDGKLSCATCHQPAYGFSSPDALPPGVAGRRGRRNAPSLVNRRWGSLQFWDGRAATLEDQALEPIESENELASSVDEVLQKLGEHDEYPALFDEAFEGGVTRANLATAIAEFERFLVSGNSRIDQFVAARESADLTRSERRGLWVYESKGGCWKCHSGPNYTDEAFHNTGVSWGREPLDLGRHEVTGEESHMGQFKTPTLRNVALTAPYMHDGSLTTLREVIDFYDRGGNENPNHDRKMKRLDLSSQEKEDLEAFLRALTGRHLWDDDLSHDQENHGQVVR